MAWTDLAWDEAKSYRALADTIAYRNFTYRDMAKRLGHGTNYYGTPRTMAKHSKVETQVIEEFQRHYFNTFPCIPLWHKWVQAELKELSYLTTLLGRRRYFFGRWNDDKNLREAIAHSPQSMTADEVDIGLLRIWRHPPGRVQLLMQVHDSILLQFPEELEDEIVPWAMELMRVEIPLVRGRSFTVPVEAKTGWNWGAHDAEDNADGLVTWKGGDTRTRSVPATGTRFSLWKM
jgi:DNA polymerase I-like protein with 3'-5' exonuclease and polymerase domains